MSNTPSSPSSEPSPSRPVRADTLFASLSSRPPLSEIPAEIRQFLTEYFSRKKAVPFGKYWVLDTVLPPYPSRAFDNFILGLSQDSPDRQRLFSVSLAVTNKCPNTCWRCSNAGRSQDDVPLDALHRLAAELLDLGACSIALTGGEPLLREDLEDIFRSFDDRASLTLNTSGDGLTAARARRLRQSGVLTVSVSLDSSDEQEHDRYRGRRGAFRMAVEAISTARDAGLYPYVMTVATPELVEGDGIPSLVHVARQAGAMEVRLLEPMPVGGMTGRKDLLTRGRHRRRAMQHQLEFAKRDDLPVFSTASYRGRAAAFGCMAGCGHIYIDGSGEVCPCNYIPLSFGNVITRPLDAILSRMGERFAQPRCSCAARLLASHVPPGPLPTSPEVSEHVCDAHLPNTNRLPAFHALLAEARCKTQRAQSEGVYESIRDGEMVQEDAEIDTTVDAMDKGMD